MTPEQKKWMGLRLQDVRMQRRIKAADLAKQLGVTAGHLSNIEHGQGASLDMILKLVEELDVSMDYIVRGIWPEERHWGLIFHDDDELEALMPEMDIAQSEFEDE